MRLYLVLIILSIVLYSVAEGSLARADSGAAQDAPANQIKARTGIPDDSSPHAVAVPSHSDEGDMETDSTKISPNNASRMGVGIQIPLEKSKSKSIRDEKITGDSSNN